MPSKFVENVHLATAKKMLDTGLSEKDVIEPFKGVWLVNEEISHLMSALASHASIKPEQKAPER